MGKKIGIALSLIIICCSVAGFAIALNGYFDAQRRYDEAQKELADIQREKTQTLEELAQYYATSSSLSPDEIRKLMYDYDFDKESVDWVVARVSELRSSSP